jgi:hypothetical protein
MKAFWDSNEKQFSEMEEEKFDEENSPLQT